MTGHIKLDRKIIAWEWYTDANTFRVFLHLLLMATHKDSSWRGNKISRGQIITGRKNLSKTLKLTEREIRTSITHLIMTNEIAIKTTNKHSVITICKYEYYQSFESYNDQQKANKPPTNRPINDQETTTFNNVNNDNNNYIYNSEGAKTAPNGVPPDVILPFINFYAKDMNGLPKENTESIIRFLKVTKKIDVADTEIIDLWQIFKVQELTGQKLYRNKEDVYRHFLNWAKKQSYQKGIRTVTVKPRQTKSKQHDEIRGVEFLNDFSECKMSDGTIKKLTENQIELARYNQINPTSITK